MGTSSLTDEAFWRDVVADKFSVRSVSSRQFSALTGLTEASAEYIWSKYCHNPFIYRNPQQCPQSEADFLMFTNFLKDYSVEDNLALYWRVGKSYFRNNNKYSLKYFSANLDEIRWENRHRFSPNEFSLFKDARIALDGTECPIQRPIMEPFQTWYYSGKQQEHTILYEVGVSLMQPEIVWCPWEKALPGSAVDITMARRTEVVSRLEPWEKMLVDKGYIGLPSGLVPVKGRWNSLPRWAQIFNSAVSSVRVDVERVINVIKTWDALRMQWRHDRSLHPHVFNVCSHFANVKMKFEPIRRFANGWLL
jgi:hypothetical protein